MTWNGLMHTEYTHQAGMGMLVTDCVTWKWTEPGALSGGCSTNRIEDRCEDSLVDRIADVITLARSSLSRGRCCSRKMKHVFHGRKKELPGLPPFTVKDWWICVVTR